MYTNENNRAFFFLLRLLAAVVGVSSFSYANPAIHLFPIMVNPTDQTEIVTVEKSYLQLKTATLAIRELMKTIGPQDASFGAVMAENDALKTMEEDPTVSTRVLEYYKQLHANLLNEFVSSFNLIFETEYTAEDLNVDFTEQFIKTQHIEIIDKLGSIAEEFPIQYIFLRKTSNHALRLVNLMNMLGKGKNASAGLMINSWNHLFENFASELNFPAAKKGFFLLNKDDQSAQNFVLPRGLSDEHFIGAEAIFVDQDLREIEDENGIVLHISGKGLWILFHPKSKSFKKISIYKKKVFFRPKGKTARLKFVRSFLESFDASATELKFHSLLDSLVEAIEKANLSDKTWAQELFTATNTAKHSDFLDLDRKDELLKKLINGCIRLGMAGFKKEADAIGDELDIFNGIYEGTNNMRSYLHSLSESAGQNLLQENDGEL